MARESLRHSRRLPRLVRFLSTANTVLLCLLAGCDSPAEPDPEPVEDLFVPIRMTELEPDAHTVISYVDWSVTTADGTYEGRSPVTSASDPIRFSFTGNAAVTRISLRGFDQLDRLRAVGEVSESSLRSATPSEPAALAFFLVDEFQAYPETLDVPLVGHVLGTATSGNPLVIGGYTSVEQDRQAVVEFDPLIGRFLDAGSLSMPRRRPGSLALDDGRLLIASDDTAEIWAPVLKSSTSLPGTFAAARPYSPSILRVGDEYWIASGTSNPGGTPGERIDLLSGILGTAPPEFLDTGAYLQVPAFFVNETGTAGVLDIVQWRNDSVERFRSDLAAVQSSTTLDPTAGYPMRLDRNDQSVLVSRVGYCTHFRTVDRDGEPASSNAVALAESGICHPIVALLGDVRMLWMGGEQIALPQNAVRTVRLYDFGTQSWTVPATPDGRSIELRAPRTQGFHSGFRTVHCS